MINYLEILDHAPDRFAAGEDFNMKFKLTGVIVGNFERNA